MLRKKYCFIILVVLLSLFVIGCGSTPGKIVYDPDLPPDRTATVVFMDSIEVVQYNGIDVKDSWYPKGKLRKNTVTLPAERTSIFFNWYANINMRNVYYTFKRENLELTYNFEPGKKYTLGTYTESMGVKTLFLGKMKVGIAIWEKIFESGELKDVKKAAKSWELGET